MSYAELLTRLGFDADPFAQTNADEEERLDKYFVSPPFFSAVYGDYRTPKASIVFAPRGGGKTALKRKIELSSQGEPFLCITYNRFNTDSKKLAQIGSEYHLRNLVQLFLVAVITGISNSGIEKLNTDDRHIIYLLVKEHLSQLDQSELKIAINSIKNFSDQAIEMWNKFTGPIGLVLNALFDRIGLGSTEIDKFKTESGNLGSLSDRMVALQVIASRLGYGSIYVLIDKIDENTLTGTADNSYKFIAPVINDLQLLETPGIAFKFFLWNLLLDDYRKVARPDRVKYYSLEWKHDQLAEMLSERLKAFSNGAISSLESISHSGIALGLDKAVAIFSQGSPRNMIRICKEILDQQSEIDPSAGKISKEAIQRGFEQIAENITRELYTDTIIKELQRTKRCDFTIRHIYLNVFKFTQPAALNKVRVWEDTGAVLKLGTIQETEGAKGSYHYGIANVLMAKHVFAELSIADFIEIKTRVCAGCGAVLIRDWDIRTPQLCHLCQQEVA
jgi:hypothetical protein